MSTRKTISVMIPCYNEVENARPIYEAVRDELTKSCPAYDYEILFIDNKSTDGTREVIEAICAADKHVKAIFNTKNFGQFNSPFYGIIQTGGDCTIAICADFQDPVALIPVFVREWEKGYKIVIGRKTRSQENKLIYALRGLYYKAIKKMSNVDMIEQFTGFGLYDRSFVDTLRRLNDPMPFMRGIVAELGPERKEIEYEQPLRRAGKTHNNFMTLYDAATLSFTSYTKTGMRLASLVGIVFSGLSLLTALVMLILKLCMWDRFVAGYAPMVIAIFLMGGLQLLFLGFLGEYVMNMNIRIMNRPLVIEEKRINFDADVEEKKDGDA